jgi:ABC transport system ATP-binding/permease protein
MSNNNVSPVIFSAENMNLAIGEQVLLNNASLTVHEGERIGLVGRNGCGKSSFLKIINGGEKSDDGLVMYKKNLTSSYLSQEFSLNSYDTVYQCIKNGAVRITELLKKYEKLPTESNEAHIIEEEITRLDGWNIDVRIKKFVNDLNIPPVDRKVETLSGGEKRRVALAKTIISMPELLILDEPTNHLDTESIEWLEDFVSSYYGTVIFVTHDRYFLDKLSTRVLELSFGKFYSYNGNYSDYVIGKSKRVATEEKLEQKRQGFLRREIDWIRSSPKARTGKSRSRIDRFDAAANALPPEKELDVELVIPPPLRIGNKIAEINEISFSFKDKKIIDNFSYSFSHGDRIGLVGRNGAGKTTLLKLLQGKLKPDKGTVDLSENVVFNYVDQGRLKLNEENSVYEEIGEGNEFVRMGNEKITIWSYLKRFLFEDNRIKTKIKFLSGGEKGRLILAKLLKEESNFIILDEPTNDLDLQTLRLLEEALSYYRGCVILVSHDRYFMDRICNGIVALSDEGKTEYFVGNYFYYKEKYDEKLKEQNQANRKSEVKGKKEKTTETRKLKWKEERELETIEGDILELEEGISDIETKFAAPDFYEKHALETESMNKELETLKTKLETMYNRWEELEKLKE